LIASGIGRISLLEFKFIANNIELELTYMKSIPHKFRQVRMCNTLECSFETLCNNVELMNINYTPTPVSIANNAQDISLFIRDTLAELELSEASVKQRENEEQELNQKLSSTNRTLYALRSINNKRKLGICNSLESTGFEFTMRPIIKSESMANSSLHTTSYLRICIKTSRFLELEDWELSLDLFPHNTKSSATTGVVKTVAVMGFETHYENGIERYTIWERDIELDLEQYTLPLKVSAALLMSVEQDKVPLRFPVSEMIVDDLHYAAPCSPDFITSMERRGLEEISNRLMNSYQKQKLYDKTGKYPFARLLKGQNNEVRFMIKANSVH
jgi:hypothetical protein